MNIEVNIQVMAAELDPAVIGRSVIFVLSLLVLLVAHQVGDHVLQTDHQAAGKAGRGWSGQALHYLALLFSALLISAR